jgi:hypothetical protein
MPFRDVSRVKRHDDKEGRQRRAFDAFQVSGDGTVLMENLWPAGYFQGRQTAPGAYSPADPEQVFIAAYSNSTVSTVTLPSVNTYSGSQFIIRNGPKNDARLTTVGTIDTITNIHHHGRDHGLRLLANADGWWILKETGPHRELSTNTLRTVTNANSTVAYPDAFIETTANASNFYIHFPNLSDRNLDGRKITVKKKNSSVGNTIVNVAGIGTRNLNAQYDSITVVRYRTGAYQIISERLT